MINVLFTENSKKNCHLWVFSKLNFVPILMHCIRVYFSEGTFQNLAMKIISVDASVEKALERLQTK